MIRISLLPFDSTYQTSSFVPPLHVCGCSSDPYAMVRPNIKMVFNENCEHPDCIMCLLRKGDTEMTLETLMERNLEVLGALQNQEVTVYAYLNFDYFGRQDQLPFSDGRIYKVVHKADDNKNCVWCVTSIEDVTDLPPSDLPQAFRDWDLGRDAAGVAPYNLSDIDRKVWKLKKEVEWIRQVEEQDEENKRLLDSNGEDDDDGVAYFDYGPKPPMSAIVLYIKDIHPTLTAEHSDAALDEILRSCLTKFEALPTEQRKVWDAREASDKARYDQEKEAHGGDY